MRSLPRVMKQGGIEVRTATRTLDGVGLMSLLPQVVDKVSVPVIAAGGIADEGNCRGPRIGFQRSSDRYRLSVLPEAATDNVHRSLLRHAKDTDTMMTDAFSGDQHAHFERDMLSR